LTTTTTPCIVVTNNHNREEHIMASVATSTEVTVVTYKCADYRCGAYFTQTLIHRPGSLNATGTNFTQWMQYLKAHRDHAVGQESDRTNPTAKPPPPRRQTASFKARSRTQAPNQNWRGNYVHYCRHARPDGRRHDHGELSGRAVHRTRRGSPDRCGRAGRS